MADWQKIGSALSGFSAGVNGTLPQFVQARTNEAEVQRQARDEARKNLLLANRGALVDLQAGRVDNARAIIESSAGLVPQEEVSRLVTMLDRGDTQGVMAELAHLDKRAVATGIIEPIAGSEANKAQFAGNESYVDEAGNYFIATRVADPMTGETRAALSPVGHSEPQKGRVRPVNNLGLTAQQIPGQKANEAAAVASATAAVELKTMPELRAAVRGAEEAAAAAVKANEQQKTDQGAYTVWETGMGSLIGAFDETLTGPVVGWLPAVTTNQQIAVGAVAAIAPVLKQLFRASGEGVFTDRDQQLLLDMAPTRKDTPEAAAWKIQNIDRIIRAKLGMGDGQQTGTRPANPDLPSVNGAPQTPQIRILSVEG